MSLTKKPEAREFWLYADYDDPHLNVYSCETERQENSTYDLEIHVIEHAAYLEKFEELKKIENGSLWREVIQLRNQNITLQEALESCMEGLREEEFRTGRLISHLEKAFVTAKNAVLGQDERE